MSVTVDLAIASDAVREWTTKRDELIRRAHANGRSLRAIAAEVGLSHGGVARIVAKG